MFEQIERLIVTSGLQWTFLRLGMFAANALNWAPQIRLVMSCAGRISPLLQPRSTSVTLPQSRRAVMIWNTTDWIAQSESGYISAAFSKDGKLALGGRGDIEHIDLDSRKQIRDIALPEMTRGEVGHSDKDAGREGDNPVRRFGSRVFSGWQHACCWVFRGNSSLGKGGSLELLLKSRLMYKEALEQFSQGRKLSGDHPVMITLYGHALARSGDAAGARKALADLQRLTQTRYVSPLYFAAVYTALGENSTALDWLDRAYTDRTDRLVYLGAEPMANPLRSDPRFAKPRKDRRT